MRQKRKNLIHFLLISQPHFRNCKLFASNIGNGMIPFLIVKYSIISSCHCWMLFFYAFMLWILREFFTHCREPSTSKTNFVYHLCSGHFVFILFYMFKNSSPWLSECFWQTCITLHNYVKMSHYL